MMGLVITIHVIVCALLIAIILIQRGRGGGLAESFSDVESMFGTKTNTFLTRTTTVLSVLFFITCLGLAVLSIKQSRSLMRNIKIQATPVEQVAPLVTPQALPDQTAQQASKTEEKVVPTPVEEARQTE